MFTALVATMQVSSVSGGLALVRIQRSGIWGRSSVLYSPTGWLLCLKDKICILTGQNANTNVES
jgi:hypothetical protein